jgi:hypothetical protein
MHPFGGGPLLSLLDWAAPMEAPVIGGRVGVQAEEQKRIPFLRFYCTKEAPLL